jgi:hypothetical protein
VTDTRQTSVDADTGAQPGRERDRPGRPSATIGHVRFQNSDVEDAAAITYRCEEADAMGEKTGMPAFGDDIPARLRARPTAEVDRTLAFVERLFPGYLIEPVDGRALRYATYPPDDVVFASSSAGLDIVCDQRFTFDHSSMLADHLRRIGDGRRIATIGTHSVVDWLSYATWSDGALVRSLNLSPDSGIIENVGEPLPFEAPYWAGGWFGATRPSSPAAEPPAPFTSLSPTGAGNPVRRRTRPGALSHARHPARLVPVSG